jgi:hypothetical protein
MSAVCSAARSTALVASDDLVKRAKAELGSADRVFRPLMAKPRSRSAGLSTRSRSGRSRVRESYNA